MTLFGMSSPPTADDALWHGPQPSRADLAHYHGG